MANANKSTQKQRDYKAERLRTQQNKLKKEQGGTDAQETQEKARKPQQEAKTVQNFDMGQCGHIDVALSSIVSDPNQPRKFFDAGKLLELSKTIVEHGVIEPILIRPIAGELYMIVFGERRFRGSLMAAESDPSIITIPAMIKDLTDDQALELQLIENLHRTDPHPIEDAYTFKRMLDKHSVEEIALRIGKSTKFVSMRLMLNDLSPAFQEVFFANKMSLGQAVTLCKVASEAQDAIFEDEVPDNWKEDTDFMLDDIERLVDRQSKNLDEATFNTEDANIYPEMGACSGCRFNSANTLQLFVEENTSRICGNSVCYNIKCVRAYKAKIEEVMVDPSIVFVAGSHYSEEAKQKVKDVKAVGATVLEYGSWRRVEEDAKPEWEQYLKASEKNYDPIYGTREEFEAYVKNEFDEEVESWEKEHEEIAAARSEGKVRKAFIVAGNGEGAIVEIIPTTPQAELALGGSDGEEDGSASLALQIAEIEKREERNKELDGEKIWTSSREAFVKGNYTYNDADLSEIEESALATAMFESLNHASKKAFALDVLKVSDIDNQKEIFKALLGTTQQQFTKLERMMIASKLFPLAGSHTNQYVNAMGFEVAKECIPDTIKNIIAEVSVKAEKRAQNVAKKIEDLKNPPPPKEKKGE
jgi:ParB/RepB/Spo0J family partition protein